MGTATNGTAPSKAQADASAQAHDLDALYSPSVATKIWKVASKALAQDSPPTAFPEYTTPGGTSYVYSPVSFWTSGFFPGCLYLLRERQLKYPAHFPAPAGPLLHPPALEFACKWWTAQPKLQASRTDTHDLGFMIQPWAQLGWPLDGDVECREALVTAARSLAARFDARVGAVRSWDACRTGVYEFKDPEREFLVVIDNIMNLDLLYHAASLTGDLSLAHIATTHALTTLRAHVRPDWSTAHLVVFDPATGTAQQTLTHQGYKNESCWTRGQAWAMAGFIQCYRRVKEPRFLDAAVRTARYWIERMPEDGVVPWDFDAERERGPGEPRDSSAVLVAAWAMLLLYETLEGEGRGGEVGEFLRAVLRSVKGIIDSCLPAGSGGADEGHESADELESVVMHATINNFEHALRRWADTGLVYADYYFLLVGNKLLEMGLVK